MICLFVSVLMGIRTLTMKELNLCSEKHRKILRKYEADRENVEKSGNGNHFL